jgi:hypothetical protein
MPHDPAADLAMIRALWPVLHAATTTRQHTTWPPTMGIAAHVRDLNERDAATETRAAERSPDQIGASPAPVRLAILDTIRQVTADLVHVADVIAAETQRPPISRAPRTAGWTGWEIEQRDRLAAADRTDHRRWPWPGRTTGADDTRSGTAHPIPAGADPLRRDTPSACRWLAGRLGDAPGPFVPLTTRQRSLIATTAAAALAAVEHALELTTRRAPLARPCPLCGAVLTLATGDGDPPTVTCTGTTCRRRWSLAPDAA